MTRLSCIDQRPTKNHLGRETSESNIETSQFLRSAIACPSSTRKYSRSDSRSEPVAQSRRSSASSAFTKYSGAIMTSRHTSRGVRACERDSISPGPPDREPLSDRPLGWDTNHGWYIKTRLTFIFPRCALVSPYVSASLPSGIFDGLVFVTRDRTSRVTELYLMCPADFCARQHLYLS